MTTMLVWLLIVTSDGVYNRGNVVVLELFTDVTQCSHVLGNLPNKSSFEAKCVQANILVPKQTYWRCVMKLTKVELTGRTRARTCKRLVQKLSMARNEEFDY